MIKGNSPCLHVFNIRDDTLNGFLFTAEWFLIQIEAYASDNNDGLEKARK
jgi:hypothetical protein